MNSVDLVHFNTIVNMVHKAKHAASLPPCVLLLSASATACQWAPTFRRLRSTTSSGSSRDSLQWSSRGILQRSSLQRHWWETDGYSTCVAPSLCSWGSARWTWKLRLCSGTKSCAQESHDRTSSALSSAQPTKYSTGWRRDDRKNSLELIELARDNSLKNPVENEGSLIKIVHLHYGLLFGRQTLLNIFLHSSQHHRS